MQPRGDDGSTKPIGAVPRVVALTMARDEGDMLQRWVAYYGAQLGPQNLVVLDDNSADGSTSELPCPVLHLPPAPWKHPWGITRRRLVNDLARGLLLCYDVVIVTDVDEFLVPDPARHTGLVGYLAARPERKVIAPMAVNVLHHQQVEAAPFDTTSPLLSQRQFVKFAPGMCKPAIKRVPANWMAGFHGIKAPFRVDPDLLMFHLKYFDVDTMREVWERRRRVHSEEERGSPHSEWPVGGAELTSRLADWVRTDDPDGVPEFDPAEVDLTGLIRRKQEQFFRTHGVSLKAMDSYPLRRVPDRFRAAL